MRALFAICGLIFLNSCAIGEIEVEQVCATKVFKSPQISSNPNYPVIQIGYMSDIDLSEPLTQSKKLGDVSVNLSYAVLSSQEHYSLDFLEKLELFFVRSDGTEDKLGETTDTNKPEAQIVFGKTSSELSTALVNGKVSFKVLGTGLIPTAPLTPTFLLCASTKTKTQTSLTNIF